MMYMEAYARKEKNHQLSELSDKKMDATKAASEPPLKHAEIVTLLKKISLSSL